MALEAIIIAPPWAGPPPSEPVPPELPTQAVVLHLAALALDHDLRRGGSLALVRPVVAGERKVTVRSAAGPGWANPACARPTGSTLGGVSVEREQNWYPIGKVGWFTQHIREGIDVTAEQFGLLQPALAQPGRLDDATVARIIRVHQDQADDLMLFQNQAGRWNAAPGLTPAQRAAVQECEASIGELRRLNAEVLAAAEQLKPVTIEAPLARSDLETFTFLFTDIEGSTALVRRLGEGLYAQVLADHHSLIRSGLAAHDGREVDTQGDAFFAVFSSPRACMAAVLHDAAGPGGARLAGRGACAGPDGCPHR